MSLPRARSNLVLLATTVGAVLYWGQVITHLSAGRDESALQDTPGAILVQQTPLAPATCPSLKYAKVTCPVWDNEQPDGGPGVDYRVRWIHEKQNPPDCETANYYIQPLLQNRYGFAIQLTSVQDTVLMGLQSNRISLVDDTMEFPYASCEAKTWECFFLPFSKCSLADVEKISEEHGYGIYWMNASHQIIRPSKQTSELPVSVPARWHPRKEQDPWWDTKDFLYPGTEEMLAAAVLYALRLNTALKDKVEGMLQGIFSDHCDFDPSRTISLAIRGTDKCIGDMHPGEGEPGESECFPDLVPYMRMAESIRKLDPAVNTIILTSDDERYLNNLDKYTQGNRWRFVTNKYDTVKGTGTPYILFKEGVQDDRGFTSFFSTLQLQLHAKYYVMNCISNFSQLIRQLVERGGCSAVNKPVFYCLSEQYADLRQCASRDPATFESCKKEKDRQIAVRHAKSSGPSQDLVITSPQSINEQ